MGQECPFGKDISNDDYTVFFTPEYYATEYELINDNSSEEVF